MSKKTKSRTSVRLSPLRVSPEEMKALHRAAERAGVDLSTWQRLILFRAAGLPEEAAVRPIGNPSWVAKGNRHPDGQ